MNKDNNSFSKGSYPNQQETIKGINFTSRELDILACMINGRRIKTIAGFLSIAPKTVETHIRNIMLKLECNSQESIINFIEKSGKLAEIKQHYISILTKDAFAQSLKEIAHLINKETCIPITLYVEEGVQARTLMNKLEESFKTIGITTTTQSRQILNISDKEDKEGKVLYIVSEQSFKSFKVTSQEEAQKNTHSSLSKAIFLIVDHVKEDIFLSFFNETNYIDFREPNNYYLAFFELLTKLLPTLKLGPILASFKQQYYAIQSSHETLGSEENTLFKRTSAQSKSLLERFDKRNKIYIVSASVCFSAFIIMIVVFVSNRDDKLPSQNTGATIKSIRSDLPLPTESNLLQRPQLVEEIKEKLKGGKGIQTVALMGIGGAGKTTLARQYAQSQKSSAIWEVNAETRESLMNSFENLAFELAKTEEEKRSLRGLLEIKNSKAREEKIKLFVREKLCRHQYWLLIYDNVEKFTDIQDYFPSDPNVWGEGKVIITTRNSNIQNNNHISYTIQMGELSIGEKLRLFIQIMSNGKADRFSSVQKEQAKKFLNNIPPFPLDVSTAAYYIKATNISYEKYLEYLSQHSKDFITTQENVLKETSEYARTRYSIISLSIKQLMTDHPEFTELLLLVTLIDSQSIPRHLLEFYKHSAVIDNFIHSLKKYSFILSEPSTVSQSTQTFSIHRSTQEISLIYLTKTLNLEKEYLLQESISNKLEQYIAEMIDNEDLIKLLRLITHCEKFLSHNNLMTDIMRNMIKGELGGIYLCFDQFTEAKQLLEECLNNLNERQYPQYMVFTRVQTYLGLLYHHLGEYKKSKELLEQSLTNCQNNFPENHIKIAQTLGFLGDIYGTLGDYERAKTMIDRSLVLYKQYSPNHVGVARSLVYLGNIYKYLGNFKRAQEALEQSLLIYKKGNEEYVGVAWVLVYLGKLYKHLGNYNEAKKLLEQSVSIYKKFFSEDNVEYAWSLASLGCIYLKIKSYDKARNLLETSLKTYRIGFPENHPGIAWILLNLGKVENETGNYRKAENYLKNSLMIYEKSYGKDRIMFARVLQALGQVYLSQSQLEKAQSYIEQSLSIFQKNKDYEASYSLELLADVLLSKFEQGLRDTQEQVRDFKIQAINYLKQAVEVIKLHFPENSPYVIRLQNKLRVLQKDEALVSVNDG